MQFEEWTQKEIEEWWNFELKFLQNTFPEQFEELKVIIKRLYKEYVRKHIKRILIALVLSIIVAGSTSGIAWLLDPAVKKIFIEQNKIFAWSIPFLIVLAFASKGLSLYFARINIIRVGEEVAGELQKKNC